MAILALLAILTYCFLKSRKKRSHRPVATGPAHVTLSEEDTLVYNSTTKPIWHHHHAWWHHGQLLSDMSSAVSLYFLSVFCVFPSVVLIICPSRSWRVPLLFLSSRSVISASVLVGVEMKQAKLSFVCWGASVSSYSWVCVACCYSVLGFIVFNYLWTVLFVSSCKYEVNVLFESSQGVNIKMFLIFSFLIKSETNTNTTCCFWSLRDHRGTRTRTRTRTWLIIKLMGEFCGCLKSLISV